MNRENTGAKPTAPPRLPPEAEQEILEALFEGMEIHSSEIAAILKKHGVCGDVEALQDSYLKRLEEKGFLSCGKEGKTNRYRARVSRAEYEQQESRTVLDRLYAGSLRRYAAALHDGGSLPEEEVRELEEYLRTLRREE